MVALHRQRAVIIIKEPKGIDLCFRFRLTLVYLVQLFFKEFYLVNLMTRCLLTRKTTLVLVQFFYIVWLF